ncbi:exosome complex component RRP40 [Eurytemora carolleeae]|uniref:exosome complex component RRP40 n=1 Tax=Eurytemora carolleeae TaxID=1294199 RepID=UPI000C78DBE1|nr:exosome complex component RRP40 [Eurytemora carolleeae]|eukprot:XP_023329231.1 exosome complex component RRP40-like [Eurytemora affinis]
MLDRIDQVVLPGDDIRDITEKDTNQVILGPGLRREGEKVLVIKPGLLKRKDPGVYWIDSHQKRYVANRADNVLGVVLSKAGDTFRVDIGTSEPASLSYLAFEGATKKNRPNVNTGDIVYAKLLVASRDMEAELVCVDSYGKKAGLGVLTGGGYMFNVPLHTVRKMLSPDSVLLSTLGKSIQFEVAVGMNGRVWVRARTVKETICLANAIDCSEFMNNSEIEAMCSKLTDVLSNF